MKRSDILTLLFALLIAPRSLMAADVPQTVEELWADFDPRKDALETEVIREFKEDGGVFRHVRFVVGTFKGTTARMTAIYGFPDGANEKKEKLPAVMHIHGGGQRAFLHEVKLLVSRGYAGLSVNWGGSAGQRPFNSVEGAQPGDPNTDWGAVDPSQLNATRYASILPGPLQVFEDREHPKNNNWYLLALGCRRGLTFLEQQPEVDAERLGVHGYSMGGNLTMYVAGTDSRVKAAVPAVGGAGWRWQPHQVLGGVIQLDHINGDVELFRRTMSFESYAPLIRCPVLHRSATNDFHGWMDDVYRTNALIPNQPLRYSWTPHVNHRLNPEVAITMPLWFDQHLKGGPALPATPRSELTLRTADRVPVLRIIPDAKSLPVARVEIYYSVDPDPRTRFWRSADVTREGEAFVAKLPLHTLDLPLFAFANAYHTLPKPESLAAIPGHRKPVKEVCLSSEYHSVNPGALQAADAVASLKVSPLIDDFSHGLRDWYPINADHPTLVQHWTRKLTDPAWRGVAGAKLKLTLKMPKTNRLSFVVIENEWRNYRGPRKTFVCEREISGSDGEQTILLEAQDFVSESGPLKSWDGVDQFAICHHFAERGTTATRQPSWTGPAPTLVRPEWE
ncbi:MAG: alpha/beta hydrolase family protein [Planctomycetaceae bacterium]